MIKIEKMEYAGWKNCVRVGNGMIDIVATLDVGPRIIRFGFEGERNQFCEVADQVGKTGGDEWKIYGGHRLWHSPENMPRSYGIDNSSVKWAKKKNGIVLKQPTESWTQIRKEIEVVVSEDKPSVTVIHKLTNEGAWAIKLSVWALSVMAPGGIEILPIPSSETGLLPNGAISLWPYTRLNDPRLTFGGKYITLKQDINAKSPAKIGITNEDGWAVYINEGNMFVKKYVHDKDASYPDYDSSFETYSCNFMQEIESLSPYISLEPGKSITHTETWALHKNVAVPGTEEEIAEKILPLVNKY